MAKQMISGLRCRIVHISIVLAGSHNPWLTAAIILMLDALQANWLGCMCDNAT